MANKINLFENELETVESGDKLTYASEIKRIIEALLFSSYEPLKVEKIKEIITTTYPLSTSLIRKFIEEIRDDWIKEKRGIQIDEIANGYLIRTIEEVNTFVELLHRDKRGEKLSKAAMEVLAIIAYKQPITRSFIDKIRGVD